MRKAQREIVEKDAKGARVDVDDRETDGEVKSVVRYEKEGYVIPGRRPARQGLRRRGGACGEGEGIGLESIEVDHTASHFILERAL